MAFMRILSFIIFLLTVSKTAFAFLEYDRAVSAAQQSNIPASIELFKQALVDQPDNPRLLYDAGVSSFKKKEYTHAASYFEKAAQLNTAKPLQEQAYFNLGNTLVELKELQKAIDAYDQVLKSNPTHTQALHNKEVAKKMLEQQQQQQKNDQQEKQNNDKQKQDSDKQQKQSSDQSDKSENQKQDQQKNQDQQQSSQQKQEQQKDTQEEEEEKSQPSPKSGGDEKQEDNQQKQDKNNQNNQKSEHKKNKDKAGTPEQKSGDANNTQQNQTNSQQNANAPQPDNTQQQQAVALPARLEKLMAENAQQDNHLNKKMMKAMVSQQSGASYEHNW